MGGDLNLDVLLSPGAEVGDYVVERKLGEGGMGAVFAAKHPVIGKRVAIKVLSPALASSPEAVERFVREARSVCEIGHRNIVDIFGFGKLDVGLHYYIMEYLEGRSLHDELARLARPLSDVEILTYMRPVFSALAAAHGRGVVHRDMKPENIYVVDQDTGPIVKLLDFGIAKLATEGGSSFKTRTGVPMGTPYYMSPEQCLGRGVDQRTDIYALGIILYQMATGRLPFAAESYLEVLQQQLHAQAEPPGQLANVPPHIERAIQWAMQKDAALRPQTVEQLWDAVEGKGTTVAQPAATMPAAAAAAAPSLPGDYYTQPGVTQAPVAQPPASRRWMPVVVAGAVAVIGVAVVLALRPTSPPPEAPLAAAPAPAATAEKPPAPPPTPTTGMLRVSVTPKDAKVTLDGESIEAAKDRSVPAGVRKLRIERDGYKPLEQTVEIGAGRSLTLSLALEKAPTAAPAAPATPAKRATKPRSRRPSRRARKAATQAEEAKSGTTKLRDKDDTAKPSWMQEAR